MGKRFTVDGRRVRGIPFTGPMVCAILRDAKTETRRVIVWKSDRADEVHDGESNGNMLLEQRSGSYWPYYVYDGNEIPLSCPYGVPGDVLYVRETFWVGCREATPDCECEGPEDEARNHYLEFAADKPKAAYAAGWDCCARGEVPEKCWWRPSIHMPMRFARIWLEVVEVRVERVQEITPAGVIAEGVTVPVSEEGHVLIDVLGVLPHLPARPGALRDGGYTTDEILRAHFAALWESLNGSRGFGWSANPWVWVVRFRRIEKPEIRGEAVSGQPSAVREEKNIPLDPPSKGDLAGREC